MMALLGQIVAGWLLADLLSGILHWIEDRLLPDGLPVLDRAVVQPNRLHHRAPMAFTAGSFFDRNGTTWMAAAALVIPAFIAFGPAPWLVAASIGGLVASQVHYWAHRPPPSQSWVAAFQRAGIIQSPGAHRRHHQDETASFCILTNLLNPLLDRTRVWAWAEFMIGRRA